VEEGPPALQAGDSLAVENPLTGQSVRGVVDSISDDVLVVLVADPGRARGAFGLRRLDAEGSAWYAETTGEHAGATGRLTLQAPGMWERDASRRSARVSADRMPVHIETFPPSVVRRELSAIDISGSGLGATGRGAALSIGTPVRVTVRVGHAHVGWIHAVVARTAPRSYELYDVGLRFTPESQAEQELILAWRDIAARRAVA
jgi:hypothetical protein